MGFLKEKGKKKTSMFYDHRPWFKASFLNLQVECRLAVLAASLLPLVLLLMIFCHNVFIYLLFTTSTIWLKQGLQSRFRTLYQSHADSASVCPVPGSVWHTKTHYARYTESQFGTSTVWYAQYGAVHIGMANLALKCFIWLKAGNADSFSPIRFEENVLNYDHSL